MGGYPNSGSGLTIDWKRRGNSKATYITFYKEGIRRYYIVMSNFKNIEYKKLALLHELGHHTSEQDGSTLQREMNAWDSCIIWMERLGIELTDELKTRILYWFNSYTKEYGKTLETTEWEKPLKICKVRKGIKYTV